MWGETRYNVVVKQVEGCSDHLGYVVSQIEETAKNDPTARELVRRLKKIIEYLDVQSLKLLAGYDPAAAVMLAEGVKKDPRRSMFKKHSGTANAEPKAIESPPEATK
jgi:hypothetical protein